MLVNRGGGGGGAGGLHVVELDIESSEDVRETNIQLAVRQTAGFVRTRFRHGGEGGLGLLDPYALAGALRKRNQIVLEVLGVALLPALGRECLAVREDLFVRVDDRCRHHDQGLDIC